MSTVCNTHRETGIANHQQQQQSIEKNNLQKGTWSESDIQHDQDKETSGSCMSNQCDCKAHGEDRNTEDGVLDPRIQMELERMNSATDEINKLEKELDEARGRFRQTLSDSSGQLNLLLKKHKKSIAKTRTHYQNVALAKKTQCETQRAAVQFRRASSFYKAAKETITLAEQRLEDEEVQFDEAWQEMLNHSTIKMMDAEKEKMRSELEHHRKSLVYQDLEHSVQQFQKSHKRSVSNAKPYYDLKATLELQLQQQKQNVEDLMQAVSIAKQNYKAAMCSLEKISEEIHAMRQQPLTLPPREPGVGCESDDDFPSEINLEKHLDFEISGSDDGFSTDADSVWSCDSGSVSHLTHQDAVSISSTDYDSAICSPKSLTLDRDFVDKLTLEGICSTPALDLSALCELAETSKTDPALESQGSTDTILYESDCESEEETEKLAVVRKRSSTIKAD